jgi:hypothetical protein
MKTWTANFTTKVEKEQGEQPCFLVHINYGTSSHLYLTNADQQISLGGNTYYPFIKSFGSLSFEMPEEDVIGTVANLDIEIMRNTTTDVLLNNLVKNRLVEVWQYFIGLVDADKLALVSLIIENIVDATQSQFTLKLKAKELELDVPSSRFTTTDYPNLPQENVDLGIPITLGNVSTGFIFGSDTIIRKIYKCYKNRSVKGIFSDKGDFKFLGHKLASHNVQGVTDLDAFKFESCFKRYVFLEADGTITANKCYDFLTTGNTGIIDLHPEDDTYPGNRRKVFFLIDKAGKWWGGLVNDVADYYKAGDLDLTTYCTINHGDDLIGSFLPLDGLLIKQANKVKVYIGFYFRSQVNDETVHLYLWGNSWGVTELDCGEVDASIYLLDYFWFEVTSYINLESFNLNEYNIRLRAVTPGGGVAGSVTVDDVCMMVIYSDEMALDKKNTQAVTSVEGDKVLQVDPIFFELKGVNDVIYPGSYSYPYNHPIYLIYAILNFVGGISASEIDAISFDAAYTFLTTNFADYGKQLSEIRDMFDHLRELLTECPLKLFKGGDNKWKLFKTNKAESSITVFRDLDEHDALTSPAMVYQMTDFIFYQITDFYNRFILNYHFNQGLGIYDKQLLKDRNNDSDLATSYSNYNNEERTMELNCNWLYTSAVAINLFTALKKYWKQIKLIVEFDTNLVGTKLELGDTIRINHKAQTWNSNAKDFQVIGLEQDGNTIHIKAIEIML